MGEDEDLYSKLYGEAAPSNHEERRYEHVSNAVVGVAEDDRNKTSGAPAAVKHTPSGPAPEAADFPAESDDELEVQLEAQQTKGEEEDDLDIKLDESEAAQPLGLTADASATQKASAPGTSSGARPPVKNATQQPKPPPKGPTSGVPLVGPSGGTAKRKYAEYDPDDPGVLPSQVTAEGQRVRLPGQTRVTPEEYKEFLGLGHGDIFLLDIDNVVDAPWRAPGVDPADYFNYGLNARTWKEYCKRVKQHQLEFTMQNNIQIYDGGGKGQRQDSDLPPELAAAVAERRKDGTTAAPEGPKCVREGGER